MLNDGSCETLADTALQRQAKGNVVVEFDTRIEVCACIVSIPAVPKREGPGAPSAWFGTIIGTGPIRRRR